MGGKGKRRREKNFLAAHGGGERLPPPPKLNEIDVLPSKLRKLMQLKNQVGLRKPGGKKRKRDESEEKMSNSKDGSHSEIKLEREYYTKKASAKSLEEKDATSNANSNDSKKRKRNRKQVNDLRFQNLDQAAVISKRKEKKKEYFESKKKKCKKEKTDDIHNFPGREEIKFGDIVEAPPKLNFPKVSQAFMDASRERMRLQAVEAYRNRRGWENRPGVKLPVITETPLS